MDNLLLQNRGVPFSVANRKYDSDFLRYLQVAKKEVGDSIKTVSIAKQQKVFKHTLARPLDHYTYVIAGATDDALPKIAAFEIFKAAFTVDNNVGSPLWHTVYGSYNDRLRDDAHYRDYEAASPSLLVLSSLATNSTAIKHEKVRDLCEIYSAVPKIIIVLGDDPHAFCTRHLYIPFTRLLFFE